MYVRVSSPFIKFYLQALCELSQVSARLASGEKNTLISCIDWLQVCECVCLNVCGFSVFLSDRAAWVINDWDSVLHFALYSLGERGRPGRVL